MTKEEMLDHFALHAMRSQIEKYGITNSYEALSETSYRVAQNMLASRKRVLDQWLQEEQYKNADLHELDLPVRIFRCLTAEGIYTKEKLCEWGIRDLRRIPNLGLKGLEKVKFAMAEAGLKLKGQP